MRRFLPRDFIVFSLYTLTGILIFWQLFFTFFQQDEWAIFGNYMYWEKAGLSWWDRLFIYQQGTHVAPLSNLFFYPQFKLFGMNFGYYAFSNILIHVINSYLLYALCGILTKRRWISILSGFVFLITSISYQAVTWSGTSAGTTGSVTFLLLSSIFLMHCLVNRSISKKLLLVSSFCWIISVLFKETSIFFILAVSLLWYSYSFNKKLSHLFKTLLFFIFAFSLYTIFRLVLILFSGDSSGQISSIVEQPAIQVLLLRTFFNPARFIAQSIVPVEFLLNSAYSFVPLAYPYFVPGGATDPYIAETIAVDTLSLLITSVIIIVNLSLYYFFKKKKDNISKLPFLLLLFISLSALPFMLIPGRGGYMYLIDGRHLYLTSIFSSILISVFVLFAYEISKKSKSLMIFSICIMILYFFYHPFKIHEDLKKLSEWSDIRKTILTDIMEAYPSLPKKVIIYAESDTAYFGLSPEEKILPFQSGLGQTLLVWYNEHGENFPSCFFKGQFLYVLQSQGYRQCEGRGFGYFRKAEDLKKSIKENNLRPENVVAFSYISSENSLKNITQKTREKLLQ
ncbi:MAG: hypothetical protein A3F31_04890 [Candidatus Levybacteria bacterium RIFCSPHIGHO2_12_FULL_38_12]|nr:MAG: hypothetical protein A3D75_01015 [Candidatus Levybacteria bacterium RIFCSPHIGHO2_02_FULL_37_18]OGH22588.1 MAG: hypothetical protein A3F31_04890 [Candidatus Levybacteria bacterium RIFCSPHIGHO2_12_FULL_38_12]OGH33375.1 MAG: hypothetical protein A3A47_03965 [Candidatus Levybacteria bacterium RIFCSPLOWO2_01_FULL_37_20]OGH44126.1 MAG: hypothetical protein A3J14_05260 [Candidatus Levybacteria bacterium RIFCSPLOWO2_02_FULL_37_18]OGH51674.1 MAG: hypothetical protein A3G13_02305 [Candidatus Levy